MEKVSVAFVDSQPIMLEGIIAAFAKAKSLEVVATGSTAQDLLNILACHRPDVIVTDLITPADVFDALAAPIRSTETKLVAFTASAGIDSAIRALDAGCSGYVLKSATSSELIEAVTCVARGEIYITQSFANKVIAALRNKSVRRIAAEAVKLSLREEEVIRLLVRGKTNKEIAIQLSISEKTVKHHMTNLMQKLNARNRVSVVIAAQKLEGTEFCMSPTRELLSSQAGERTTQDRRQPLSIRQNGQAGHI